MLKVFFRVNANVLIKSVSVYNPNGKNVLLNGAWFASTGLYQLTGCQYAISGTSMTRSGAFYANIGNTISAIGDTSNIGILTVMGYKYAQ